jgi:MFS family permease
VVHKNPYSFSRVWHEFKEGVEHFWENKMLHYPLLSLIGIQIVNGMIITIAPAFMKHAIDIDLNTGSIWVVTPLGLGILLGALTLGYEEKYLTKRDLILVGFIGMGAGLFSLSFIDNTSHHYWYYSIHALIIGFFNAHIFAPSHSIIQTHAMSTLRGRIYGTLYVMLQIAATIPTIIIGLLADKIAITYIVAILGCVLVLFGYIIKPRSRPV